MNSRLSVVIITKNAGDTLEACLKSVFSLSKDILVVDDYSRDQTKAICDKYKVRFYRHWEYDLGKQKKYALSKAAYEWILNLDADEMVTNALKREILTAIKKGNPDISGYIIPFHNHLFGKPVTHGGENYKMLRLFKKRAVSIEPSLVHEKFTLKFGKSANLHGFIDHFSYRSPTQLFSKFTDYARRDAQQKFESGERANFKKLTLYPLHMFYARYIKDHGYKDGFIRIVLDLGFAYMEFMTYLLLLYYCWMRPPYTPKVSVKT